MSLGASWVLCSSGEQPSRLTLHGEGVCKKGVDPVRALTLNGEALFKKNKQFCQAFLGSSWLVGCAADPHSACRQITNFFLLQFAIWPCHSDPKWPQPLKKKATSNQHPLCPCIVLGLLGFLPFLRVALALRHCIVCFRALPLHPFGSLGFSVPLSACPGALPVHPLGLASGAPAPASAISWSL